MRKLPKNHYLTELFTKSLQGKSWLEIGNDQTELSRQLARALKTQDFKVASHSPREPHMLRFKDSDLSQVPDKAYDYVLFNWSIGKFTTQSILNEAKRIAREGIIVQDFLAAGDRVPAGVTTPNYQLYEDQQWKEILSSYGRVIVTQQLPEQAIELGMRIPMQVRLFVVQVDDVRDTLPAAPDPDDFALHFAGNMPPNSSTIAFGTSVLELTPQQQLLLLGNPPTSERRVHQPNLDAMLGRSTHLPPLVIHQKTSAVELGNKIHQELEEHIRTPGEAVATFRPPAEDGPFPHTPEDLLAAADARNFRDFEGEPTSAVLDMFEFQPPAEQGGTGSFRTLSAEELEAEYERIRNKPLEELTEYERFVGRTRRQGQQAPLAPLMTSDQLQEVLRPGALLDVDHKHLEIDTFLGSSGGTAKED